MLKQYLDRASKFIEENKFSGIVVSLVSYLLVALFCFTVVYERFELNLYDLRFKLMPSVKEWDRLAFLDIDENSLTIVGQYPWPRNLYAQGLKSLKEVSVAQTSFDMMFPDASPKTIDDNDYEALVKRAGKADRLSIADLEAAGLNKDKVFAGGVASLNRVNLSYTFNDEPLNLDVLKRQESESFKRARKRFDERSSLALAAAQIKILKSLEDPATKSISYPIPELMNAGYLFGFVNRFTDIDGTVRQVQLVKVFQGRIYFNLALVMLVEVCQVPLKNIEIVPGSRIVLKNALNPITQSIEDLSIPIDDKGMMYVAWAGSGEGKGGRRENTFHLIPFYALLEYRNASAFDKEITVGEYARKLFAQEDRIKIGHLDEFNQQLDNFTEEYNEADPAMRKNLETGIAEIKKKIATLKKNPLLGNTAAELEKARKEYTAAAPGTGKLKKWQRVEELKKLINRIKLEYLNNYDAEITAIKNEAKKSKNQDLDEQLKKLSYDRQAMELSVRVEDLADRIGLAGLTAAGTQDIGAIPLYNEYARVGTYHNTINTIVQKEFIRRINWPVNLGIMLVIAVLMGFMIQRLDAKRSLLAMLVIFVLLNVAVMFVFAFFNVWMQQLGVALSMFLPSLAIVAVKFMKEESQKRFIKSAFSYYLSPSVIDEIIKDPESLELGGEDREITIFFSDIRSFSSISEKLSPRDLVVRLNEYLTEMTDIVLKYNGTVDKYIGDAIMAFYGAPIIMPDHPARACMAAIEMKKRLRELQEKWRNAGMEELHARIGIHSGKATVGNMGSRTRMDYTAMGDAVNLASRLEGLNKYYATSAMFSGSTFERVKDIVESRQLDIVRVVGKSEAVPIYELLGPKGSIPDRIYEMLAEYNRGRDSFLNRDWKQARSLFKQALRIVPDDGPSMVFVKRCEDFMKNPPPRTWDGVYVLKGK